MVYNYTSVQIVETLERFLRAPDSPALMHHQILHKAIRFVQPQHDESTSSILQKCPLLPMTLLVEIFEEVHDLEVPNDFESLCLHAIYVAINAIQTSNDSNAPATCIVCGGIHRFDSCKVLKNTDFLCGDYIHYCQQLRRNIASRAASFPGTSGDFPLPHASGDVTLPRAPDHTLEATPIDLPLEQHSSDDESVTDFQNACC